jgi:hypothetical protein
MKGDANESPDGGSSPRALVGAASMFRMPAASSCQRWGIVALRVCLGALL